MSFINDLTQINIIKQNIKNAIINKGQTVTNFASYPNAISNIAGGGVYQYDSLENMYADISNHNSGDLATVYASSQAPITDTTEFQVATFPQTVVLDEALSDYVEVGFQAVDESVMFDCWGQLDSNYFSMDCYADDVNIRIQYESQDGITYNRTRFRKNEEDISGNEMDFGMLIKFGSRWGSSEFNPAIGKFIIAGTTVFDGVFKYNGSNFGIINSGLNVTNEQVWVDNFYGYNGIQTGNLNQTTNLNLAQLKDRVNLYSNLSYLELNTNITNIIDIFSDQYNLLTIPNLNTINVIDMTRAFYLCNHLVLVPNLNTSNVNNMAYMFGGCSSMQSIPKFDTSNVINMSNLFWGCSNLSIVPNINTFKLVYANSMFRGCKNLENVPNFDTCNVVSMTSMFEYCNSLETVPNFNTTNVTSMMSMFFKCTNLTTISNFDTSNVTNMYAMFDGCYNLLNILDFNTSNVTNMANMFGGCHNLINVPQFDTSNVTNMANMFVVCTNLTTMPNFNTSNVINMYSMFQSCTNLTNIPNFNTSKVISMMYMFTSCNNLSEASYANIVNSLPPASQLSNQYIASTGLNINKFTSAQNTILKNKGYLEFQQNYYTITYSNVV